RIDPCALLLPVALRTTSSIGSSDSLARATERRQPSASPGAVTHDRLTETKLTISARLTTTELAYRMSPCAGGDPRHIGTSTRGGAAAVICPRRGSCVFAGDAPGCDAERGGGPGAQDGEAGPGRELCRTGGGFDAEEGLTRVGGQVLGVVPQRAGGLHDDYGQHGHQAEEGGDGAR